MDLSKIIAISGYPGLFRIVGQMKNGIIVESLITGKRMPAYASHKISALEDISMYTYAEDVPLKDVMQKIMDKEGGEAGPDHKITNEELKNWFLEVLPDYDQDRVYVSDIKKLLRWYNELESTGNLKVLAEGDGESEDSTEENEPKETKSPEPVAETVEAEEANEESEETDDSKSNDNA